MRVIRFLPTGERDESFAEGGTATIAAAPLAGGALGVTDAGRVFVQASSRLFALTPAGVLDPSWGSTDGFIEHPLVASGQVEWASFGSLAFDESGRVYSLGPWETDVDDSEGAYSRGWALLRLNPDGSLDAGFGVDGVISGMTNGMGHLVIGSSGVTVAGERDGNFVLLRFTANGTPDSSFGSEGRIEMAIGQNAFIRDVEAVNDGTTLLTGGYGYQPDEAVRVVRF